MPQGKRTMPMSADKVSPKPKRWLWFPYIPFNHVTMIFGIGGVGKSYVACEIAARVSQGQALPGQKSAKLTPRRVLLVDGENDPEEDLAPRMKKQGANTRNVFLAPDGFILDKEGLKYLEEMIDYCGPSLVVIDPLAQYMGGKIDINKMNEVRAITGALNEMARKHRIAIVIVHHARKGAEGASHERASGSSDLVNAPRSTLFAYRGNDGTPILEQVKTNEVLGKPLIYTIDEDGLTWGGTVDAGPANPSKPAERAKDFLKKILADGPLRATDIAKGASEYGVSMGTVNRIKPEVAQSFIRWRYDDRQWFWRLTNDTREPEGVTKEPEPDPEKQAGLA